MPLEDLNRVPDSCAYAHTDLVSFDLFYVVLNLHCMGTLINSLTGLI